MKKIIISLPEELHTRLASHCKKNYMSVSGFIRSLALERLKVEQPKEKQAPTGKPKKETKKQEYKRMKREDPQAYTLKLDFWRRWVNDECQKIAQRLKEFNYIAWPRALSHIELEIDIEPENEDDIIISAAYVRRYWLALYQLQEKPLPRDLQEFLDGVDFLEQFLVDSEEEEEY